MQQLTSPSEFSSSEQTAIAIGKFDGIHLGHQQLLHELVEYCSEESLVPTVITFDRHPLALFDPERCPKPLIGPNQKNELLSSAGVELLVTLTFDRALADLSPAEFVQRCINPLSARMIFVGEGFRFGKNGAGTVSDLRELGEVHGFRVREIPPVEVLGRKISSTDIRGALEQGRVDVASFLLGRNHQVSGLVEHGRKLGRTLGFPTANIARDAEGYLPGDGIYAGFLIANGVRYPAAHSVGTNDSVGAVPKVLESHVIGRDDLDLYDQIVVCEFVELVRGWAKFESLEELIFQISEDVKQAQAILEK